MKEWTLRHALRLAGYVAAVAPVVVAVLDTLPWQWAVSLSAVALSAGETAQRVKAKGAIRAYLPKGGCRHDCLACSEPGHLS